MDVNSTAADLAKNAGQLFHYWERLNGEMLRGTHNTDEGLRLQKSINDATWNVKATFERLQAEADKSDSEETRVADAGARVSVVFVDFLNNRGGRVEDLRDAMAELDHARRQLARKSADAGKSSGAARSAEMPASARPTSPSKPSISFDVFICHAWEDKETLARPLYHALNDCGVSVWFDEVELTLGDPLSQRINEGLSNCRFGVVIFSPDFFQKQWPQKELRTLLARETLTGHKAILPIWHEIDAPTLANYSPVFAALVDRADLADLANLADRIAARSSDGIPALVDQIRSALAH